MLLAWGRDAGARRGGRGPGAPTGSSNVLYYVPAAMGDPGHGELPGRPAEEHDDRVGRGVLQQGPVDDQLRAGHASTVAYRPIAFEGTPHASATSGSAVRASARTDRSRRHGGVEIQPIPDACLDARSRHPAAGRLPEAAAAGPVRRHAGGRGLRPDRRRRVAPPAAPRPGPDLRCGGRRRGTSTRHGRHPRPVRERRPGPGRVSTSTSRSRGPSSDRRRRHPRARQALSRARSRSPAST